MRFKVGDEVIIVNLTNPSNWGKNKEVYVIGKVVNGLYMSTCLNYISLDREVELLSIYESPLYKALL